MSLSFGKSKTKQQEQSSTNENLDETDTPIVPDDWMTNYNALFTGLQSGGGLNSEQQNALSGFRNFLSQYNPQGSIDAAQRGAQGAQDALQGVYGTIGGAQAGIAGAQGRMGTASNSLNTISRQIADRNPLYNNLISRQAGTMKAAQIGGVPEVQAKQGASFMGAYYNPFEERVIDTSLDQARALADEQSNALRARYTGSGAARGGRQGVAEGQFAADTTRDMASLGAGLRSQGFNIAAGYGSQDASRDLQAGQGNQQVALARALRQGDFDQDAARANLDEAFRTSQFQLGALNDQGQNLLGQAGVLRDAAGLDLSGANLGIEGANLGLRGGELGLRGAGLGLDSARLGIEGNANALRNYSALFDAGQLGTGNLLDLLQLGTQRFGRRRVGTRSGTSSGTRTGSGTNFAGGIAFG